VRSTLYVVRKVANKKARSRGLRKQRGNAV